MNTEHPMMDERLWDYIDGLSSTAERSAIEILIADNREWQKRYQELLHTHQLLNSQELEAPSMRFTKNVMEEIARFNVAPATKTYINKNIIRGIGTFFLAMIGGLLLFVIAQIKWLSGSSAGKTNTTYDNLLSSASSIGQDKFNWIKTFSNTWFLAFLTIVMILGWIMLDIYLTQQKERTKTA